MEAIYISFAVTEGFLILLTIVIVLRLDVNFGSETEVRNLRHILYSYMIMLAANIVCRIAESGVCRIPAIGVAVMEAVTLVTFAGQCYEWQELVRVRLQTQREERPRWKRILLAVPFFLCAGLDCASVGTGWVFYLDEGKHYQHGSLYPVQLIVCYFYLAFSLVWTVRTLMKTKESLRRRECLLYLFYLLLPILAWLTESTLTAAAPVRYLGMYLIFLILFLTIQEKRIYSDGLTGLNNRRRLGQYLEDLLSSASEKKPVGVIMMDINSFKAINDTYGHVEGDRVLRLTADALKRTAGEYNAFAARYGGDEFCLISRGSEIQIQEIADRFTEILLELQQEREERAYTFSLSIGWTICRTANRNAAGVIRAADVKLYERKRQRKKRLDRH